MLFGGKHGRSSTEASLVDVLNFNDYEAFQTDSGLRMRAAKMCAPLLHKYVTVAVV